jgi:hypothetical protein
MAPTRDAASSARHAGHGIETAEDANRRAAAERALRLEGLELIEDRRRRSGTRADRREGRAEG